MANSDHVGMQFKTQDKLSKALEACRTDGFAVVGFALRPDDNALMQINNQGMDPLQFLMFVQTAMRAYMTTLPEADLKKLQQTAEA